MGACESRRGLRDQAPYREWVGADGRACPSRPLHPLLTSSFDRSTLVSRRDVRVAGRF